MIPKDCVAFACILLVFNRNKIAVSTVLFCMDASGKYLCFNFVDNFRKGLVHITSSGQSEGLYSTSEIVCACMSILHSVQVFCH
jgi:hypothetical protein